FVSKIFKRSKVVKIQIVTPDVKKWLALVKPISLDFLSLSNICELMGIEETATTFKRCYVSHEGADLFSKSNDSKNCSGFPVQSG
ncbi:MAG: hypothetical protein VX432_09635, partial [Candidatus Poribacteria bacterium]|nr:hypothetical protein [Candidatus Poribacteria bacterium]